MSGCHRVGGNVLLAACGFAVISEKQTISARGEQIEDD